MATKPRSQLSAAYRRRIERAEARGKTRQQARGHKAREHVERAARERALGDLTTYQKSKIREFISRQSGKGGLYIDPHDLESIDWNDFYQTFRINGYDLLNRMKKFVRLNYTASAKANKRIYKTKQDMLDEFGNVGGVEPWMLYYHGP